MNSQIWIAIQLMISILHANGKKDIQYRTDHETLYLLFQRDDLCHKCGDGIYQGELAEDGQFKYIALIYGSVGDAYGICGGAIIDELHILTAAHCVVDCEPNNLLVLAGITNSEDLSGRRLKVEKIHVHRNYQPVRSINHMELYIRRLFPCVLEEPEIATVPKNDVAVLKLAEVLPLGNNLMKVRLPETSFLPYCQELQYAGWGDKEELTPPIRLKYTTLIIFDSEECKRREGLNRKEQFCGTALNEISLIAPGDSGGPVVDADIVYGITSFVDIRDPRKPAGFMKVFPHRRFIEAAMKD